MLLGSDADVRHSWRGWNLEVETTTRSGQWGETSEDRGRARLSVGQQEQGSPDKGQGQEAGILLEETKSMRNNGGYQVPGGCYRQLAIGIGPWPV